MQCVYESRAFLFHPQTQFKIYIALFSLPFPPFTPNPMLNALWLSVSPSLDRFDQRLIRHLTRQGSLHHWEYHQTPDEPCCLETAIVLLHDFLKQHHRPVHLLGHGISGVVGLLYAQKHPERVRSLTLLSVGANPAISWHTHYYALRNLLPCSRDMILAQMIQTLFGPQGNAMTTALVALLQQDLDYSLTPHSLVSHTLLTVEAIVPPLLICHGGRDTVLDPNAQLQWQYLLKPRDHHWTCLEGRHFFHYEYPQQVAETIHAYWRSLESPPLSSPIRPTVISATSRPREF